MQLEEFIIEAKAASYIGGATHMNTPCRLASHDIAFEKGSYSYLDSYFDGTDFIGQETVWQDGKPIWGMNYYGRILDPHLMDGARAGLVIKEALGALYQEGRFLGGFEYRHVHGRYVDENSGNILRFQGIERIYVAEREAYRLDYHGGQILP